MFMMVANDTEIISAASAQFANVQAIPSYVLRTSASLRTMRSPPLSVSEVASSALQLLKGRPGGVLDLLFHCCTKITRSCLVLCSGEFQENTSYMDVDKETLETPMFTSTSCEVPNTSSKKCLTLNAYV